MTKDELAKKYVPCQCDKIYTSRGLTAPDCPFHSTDPEAAMEEWAKQQAIAFDEWRIEKRYFNFKQGHYYHTFEQGTAMSDNYYREHYVKTREKLYDLFIEHQNKTHATKS